MNLIIGNGQGFDFGKIASEYAKYRVIYPKELYDRLLSLGVGRTNSVWPDFRAGTGVILRGLADYGANAIGVDISSEQIEQAKKLSEDYKNITYTACHAEEYKFADNSFDTITACQCFGYFDPKIVVDKIKQMIKPNGLFLKLYMSYLKDTPIARESHSLVKQLNPNWVYGLPQFRIKRNIVLKICE